MSNQSIVEFEKDQQVFREGKKSEKRYIIVSFDDQAGVDQFAKLMGQRITSKTKKLTFGAPKQFLSGLFSEE